MQQMFKNKMLPAIVLGFFSASYVMAMTSPMTTRHPHHPHAHHNSSTEAPEVERFKFFYQPHTHKMLVVTHGKCYIFALSDSERAAIHTDAGIRAVELRLLSTLNYARVTEVTKDQLDGRTVHMCGSVKHYFKETAV